MKKAMRFIVNTFLNKKLDFRVRLFNVLAIAGALIGLLMTLFAVFTKAGAVNIISNVAGAALAFGLLVYSYRSGHYRRCYIITIAAIFLGLFPLLFFTSEGYRGGMPSFFIFAVLFTVFMLEGGLAVIMTALEIAVYTALCIYVYIYPEQLNYYPNELSRMSDVVFSYAAVSVGLGVTMFLHFRMYNEQRRELEAAKEEAFTLSKTKSNFLANMSHEIRTPINVMLGMNEMILRESESEQVKSYSTRIQSAGKTLLLLINNILDVSKIESGKLTFAAERYQTEDLIGELFMIGTEQAERFGLAFHTQADGSLPRVLVGDEIHIKEIIINFLSNAAKYTKEGGFTLSAGQKPGNSPDEILLCISVADTGIGIKEEKFSLLFDAFMRADMPSNRYIEGTGLGLAIAKELTELMGGRIHVESQWGKGSVFSIEIPQKIADRTPVGNIPRPAVKELQATSASFIAPGGIVLVVDDNKENSQVIRSLLARTMLRIDVSDSGADCLTAVGKLRYDVILTDYMMPDMDGMETLNRLRMIPGFDTPVVAVTANVTAGVKEQLLEAGFSEYLSKPVMWRDLESVILALLPEKLVTKSILSSGDIIPAEIKNELAKELLTYGVILSDGLHYLSGDVVQYKAMASFFTQNYERGGEEISRFAARKNFERMIFCVHSLKSKARAIGANDLAATAAKLETVCAAGEDAYIAVTLPVLYYEWERAKDGLTAFNARLDALFPDVSPRESAEETIDELLLLLKHNRQPDAIAALDRMIAAERSPEMKNRLREVWRKVDDIELREAERLIIRIKEESESDGK